MCGLGWQGKWGEYGTAFLIDFFQKLLIHINAWCTYLCYFLAGSCFWSFLLHLKGGGILLYCALVWLWLLFGLCGWRETKEYWRTTQGRVFLYVWDKLRIWASHWASIPFLQSSMSLPLILSNWEEMPVA